MACSGDGPLLQSELIVLNVGPHPVLLHGKKIKVKESYTGTSVETSADPGLSPQVAQS